MMKLIRLKYFSDIHLEYFSKARQSQILKKSIPSNKKPECLALLGDIGHPKTDIYKNFIKETSLSFEKVFLIAGNHEYYGSNIQEINHELEKLQDVYKNVYFMNRRRVCINNKIILGCTLWTRPLTRMSGDQAYSNDFLKIKNLDSEKYVKMHDQDVKWLTDHIVKAQHPLIILTHHLPTFKLIGKKYEKYKSQDVFATNLEHLFDLTEQPIEWLCGHSHDNIDINLCDRRVNLHINSSKYIDPEKYIEI